MKRLLLAYAAAFAVAVAVGYWRASRCENPDCRMCARAAGIP